jgi:hypothetical protein
MHRTTFLVAGQGVHEGAWVKDGALRRVLERFGELMAMDCAKMVACGGAARCTFRYASKAVLT